MEKPKSVIIIDKPSEVINQLTRLCQKAEVPILAQYPSIDMALVVAAQKKIPQASTAFIGRQIADGNTEKAFRLTDALHGLGIMVISMSAIDNSPTSWGADNMIFKEELPGLLGLV